jgi:hydroxyethylthiazole kinase-like uncharacterized protein yjeF
MSLEALPMIREQLSWADVVLLGPGLGRHEAVREIVRSVLREFDGSLLLDADALTAVGELGLNTLLKSRASITLTPHAGEFSRLTGRPVDEVEMNRIDAPRTLAEQTKTTVVLKGAPTATASKDGSVVINSTGNPGMATAGAGDVLAGVIAGLWAQGMTQNEAAWCGALIHGLAGDVGEKRIGQRSLIAGDLIDFLPDAFRLIETGGTP